MIDNTSKILLTVSRGKSLTKVGAYQPAEVEIKNPFTTRSGRWRQLNPNHFRSEDGEEVIAHKPMQIIHQPEYRESTQVVNLGYHFIKNALTIPKRPQQGFYRWIKTPMGKLFQDWKKLSETQKLQVHLEEVAESLGGTVKSWELI